MKFPIAFWRDQINELWHNEMPIWLDNRIKIFQTEERFNAFCAAKDLLQDSSEALVNHRRKGFSSKPLEAYLEFWGVLQAIIIQQDSICELQYSIIGTRTLQPTPTKGSHWHRMRDFRNLAAGHPAAKGLKPNQKTDPAPLRSATARTTKTYDIITLAALLRTN